MKNELLTANIPIPKRAEIQTVGGLIGASNALALAALAIESERPLLVLADDAREADRLDAEIRYFADDRFEVRHFPDWETLPWDNFSPHQDIISERLSVLATLSGMQRGIAITTASVLLQRLPPTDYVTARTLSLTVGQNLPRDAFVASLSEAGYLRVPQVSEHGEFAVRGSLIDLYPMGSDHAIRIDFFDDDIESLRHFSTHTQLSGESLDAVNILPAREVPLDTDGVRRFREAYRERFEGQPSKSRVYSDVSDGIAHGGIEYYIPLFFDQTASLLDYIPDQCLIAAPADIESILNTGWQDIVERYELSRLDPERPILSPDETFLSADTLIDRLGHYAQLRTTAQKTVNENCNIKTQMLPAVKIEARFDEPAGALLNYLNSFKGRVLLTAESAGRREQLYDMLTGRGFDLHRIDRWSEFRDAQTRLGVGVAPISNGLQLADDNLAIIGEHQLFGDGGVRRSRRKRAERDPETIIRQLNDLEPGSPVVHAEYGVGRYLGLKHLDVGGIEAEFLHLEYADGDKLYVPVHALELISRFTGASPENAPLHRLGSDQWAKARKRAVEKIRDAAAELLDIYARRAARPGHAYRWPEAEYRAFEAGFPFQLTEDQQRTISEVLTDMADSKPMDRIVCGDVGFGKTEVALRAAFAAVNGGKQVAVLVPTTLLAQQHGETFRDRFADWPFRIEVLSRFQSNKEAQDTIHGLRDGKVDIVIGTHRLLTHTRDIKNAGLLIIDEEHRFGVRHKEAIKSLKSQVDVLTLTATPIPRTMNMALGGIRDMSLIATPPSERLAVKTFVTEWNDVLIREALLREIKRGGQVYFVHNRVEDIESVAERIAKLVPEASLRIGHGQMRERELERVMFDFYHRRFNVLLCTTIVESGLDVPTANTIVINRADRFGLAQLHQLRGRVGRSHHRAFAYLVTPPRAVMTADAIKRLEAIDSLEDLGAGFTLATHDLEIRGAGELLGDVQSGQIQEIGFSLYTDLLARAVESLKAGTEPDLDAPFDAGIEINVHAPALLPEDFVPDVHLRLMLYKRIASTASRAELDELQVELIDRFGLLPPPAKNLMRIAAIKQTARQLGIDKIDAGDSGGYLIFGRQSQIDPVALVQLVQNDRHGYQLRGSHRLQFAWDTESLEERFGAIETLLARLQSA